jgi:hypothetical protein
MIIADGGLIVHIVGEMTRRMRKRSRIPLSGLSLLR